MSDREEIRPLRRLLRPPEGEPSPAPHLREAQQLPLHRLDRGLPPEAAALAPGPPPRRWASSLVAALLALSLGSSLVALTLVGVGSVPVPPPVRAPEPLTPEIQAPPFEVAVPPVAETGQPEGAQEEGGEDSSPAETPAQPAVLAGREERDSGGGDRGDGGGDGQGGAGGKGDQAGEGGGGGQGGGGQGGGPPESTGENVNSEEPTGSATEGVVADGGEVGEKVTGRDKAKKSKAKGADKGTGGKALGHIKGKGKGHLKDTPGLGHDKHHVEDVVEELGGVPGIG